MTESRAEAAEAELARLVTGRFSPQVAELGLALVARIRRRIPQAYAMVFDTHALGVGFGPCETA